VGEAARLSDKSQFVLQVTHELRSPITAVLGHHEMILKGLCGEIGPDIRSHIEKANTRVRKLLDIVDEMLDYARMAASNEPPANRTEIKLNQLVQEMIDGRGGDARCFPVEIINQVPTNFIINSNRDLLRIVLSGLLANAEKYSPAGGTINLSALHNRGFICVTVADQGMGIEKDEIGRIFEEFYRSRRARILNDNGTGLGLAIVCKAISCLHGHICVKSEPNEGTLFNICLPFASAPFDCPCDAHGRSCTYLR
jgi:signal transduction histidine kinase